MKLGGASSDVGGISDEIRKSVGGVMSWVRKHKYIIMNGVWVKVGRTMDTVGGVRNQVSQLQVDPTRRAIGV